MARPWITALFCVLCLPISAYAHGQTTNCSAYTHRIPGLKPVALPVTYDLESRAESKKSIRFELLTQGNRYERETALLYAVADTLIPHLPPYARGWRYEFVIREWEMGGLNARAYPGGLIAVSAQSLHSGITVSIVATILAHEMGHVALRHTARSDVATLEVLMRLVLWFADEGAVSHQTALHMHPRKKSGFRWIPYPNALSRQHELEADIFAAHVASRAGYDVREFAAALERLGDLPSTNPSARTHPARSVRASVFRCFPHGEASAHTALTEELNGIMRNREELTHPLSDSK